MKKEDACTPAERLEIIAQWLEAGAPEAKGVKRFNMHVWITAESRQEINTCGTTACIGGTTIAWWGDKNTSLGDSEEAAKLLGLSYDDAEKLFFDYADEPHKLTPRACAKVIRYYQKTSQIDWSKAK